MIEFFFDCSSPWTYLAFHNIQPLAIELDKTIVWKPVLVGGIFNSVNPSVYAMREQPVPSKMNYMIKDLEDWAQLVNLKICMPPKVFPVNSVKAMRACLWLAPQGKLVPFASAVFEAYWSREEDISQDAVLSKICETLDIDAQALLAGIAQADIKAQLKANTEEAIQRGAFGTPTLFFGEDMYFGNDRLPLLKAAILRFRRNYQAN
jgi:2-hydroxychromene-2-carboxylate isomerase